jgi:hypothetical protein
VLEKHHQQQHQQHPASSSVGLTASLVDMRQQQDVLPEFCSTPVSPSLPTTEKPPPAVQGRPGGMSAANTMAVMAAAGGAVYAAHHADATAGPAARLGPQAAVEPLRRHNSAPITTGEVVVSRPPSTAMHSVTTHGPTP